MEIQELSDLAKIALTKLPVSGVASYGCVDKNGTIWRVSSEACHYSAPSKIAENNAKVMFTATNTRGISGNSKDYFKWISSEMSPWATCLHNDWNQDIDYIVKYGFIINNLDVSSNLMIGALAATRGFREHSQHIRMFNNLLEKGLKPHWAYFVCGCWTFREDNKVVFGMRSNQNHWPTHPWSAGEEYISNFLNNNFKDVGNTRFALGHSPTSVGGSWGPVGKFTNTPLYGNSCYSQSVYWSSIEERMVPIIDNSGFGEQRLVYNFDDLLKIMLEEQERFYDRKDSTEQSKSA